MDVRQRLTRLRRQFADRMERLDETAWNTASWCEGWRVRDVLAHLVWGAEATSLSWTRDMVRGGFLADRIVTKAAARLGDVPVPELAERLRRAEGGIRIPGMPEAIGLGDVVVHSADAFRPLGLDEEIPVADALTVLEVYVRRGRLVVHATPHRGRRLVATDLDWAWGTGPEVEGTVMDLLLLVANRRQVLSELRGPGVAGL